MRLFVLSVVLLCFSQASSLFAETSLSPATERALLHFKKLNREIDYGRSVSEKLLRCSYLQNAWLTYLYEAESKEEFLQGMALINQEIRQFKTNVTYAATVINFFNPGKPHTLFSQSLQTEHGEEFLNTFKTGIDLGAQERERLFDEEWIQFQKESVQEPFILNAETLPDLVSGRLYNFVLLPEGTIRVALEKPQGKEYTLNHEKVTGDMAYPNHTILAGAPHQSLLTAGALMLYRHEDKQMVFISNKSGHFVPSFHSLDAMKNRFLAIGIDPQTVIAVPTVNLSDAVISLYHAQIPIYMMNEDLSEPFEKAFQKWMCVIKHIDLPFLTELSQGNFTNLNRQAIDRLNQLREESTYMRSAYRLYAMSHKCPHHFHQFVKHFGKLKDGIKHGVDDVVIAEAKWVCYFLQYEMKKMKDYSLLLDNAEGFYQFVYNEIQTIKVLNNQEKLSIHEFHKIKKGVRELGFLFQCLAEEFIDYGQYHFVYEAMMRKLFNINQQMALIHDEQIGKIMHGETTEGEIILEMPPALKQTINTFVGKIGIIPDHLKIEISNELVSKIINEAKEWYFYHYIISKPLNDSEPNLTTYPLPRKLLNKIAEGMCFEPDEEDFGAIELLRIALRSAEIARNMIIIFDTGHEAPAEWDLYIDCLRKIIKGFEKRDTLGLREEAKTMIKFISRRGNPNNVLQTYQCTEQEGFDKIFARQLSFLNALKSSYISYNFAEVVRERVQSIADLMHVFLLLGEKYQQLPTICYEKTLQDCEMIVEEITHQMKYLDIKGNLVVPSKIGFLADRLIERWSFLEEK